MGGFDVHLRKSQVTPNHFHCTVTQNILQRVRVAAVPKIRNGKCVPETVWMTISDPGTFPDFRQ